MDMKMRDFLAPMLPIIDNNSISFVQFLQLANFSNSNHHFAQNLFMSFFSIRNSNQSIFNFGDNKNVDRCLWVNISKGKDMLIFIDNIGWNLFADYLVEYCLVCLHGLRYYYGYHLMNLALYYNIQQQHMNSEQQAVISQHPYFTYQYPTLNASEEVVAPVLNKIATDQISNSLYAAYSDGKVLRYDVKSNTLTNIFSIYDKTDVIDIEPMGQSLLTCSHNQLTIFDIIKQKSLSLKGHEQTPISASAHPTSPLVVSVSNLVIQHDLRIQKPINVNFITPPVYSIKYFADGSYYFLSGQPCRVGRNVWVRTLLNGIGNVSDNSKFIAVNQMNGNLVLWNWRKSTREVVISDVKNEEVYQAVFFRRVDGEVRGLVFLEDDGCLLQHDILATKTYRRCILPSAENENWKIHVDGEQDTKLIYTYEHEKSVIKCYQVSNMPDNREYKDN